MITEKDIENLIVQYPDDFFPGAGFKLKGRQVSLGNYRADVVFTDKYERLIMIEIKKGTLSRDAAGQLIDYYGILKQENTHQPVELILCANVIPVERRTFLEKSGIECREISEAKIIEVANKYSYCFLDIKKMEPLTKELPTNISIQKPIIVQDRTFNESVTGDVIKDELYHLLEKNGIPLKKRSRSLELLLLHQQGALQKMVDKPIDIEDILEGDPFIGTTTRKALQLMGYEVSALEKKVSNPKLWTKIMLKRNARF